MIIEDPMCSSKTQSYNDIPTGTRLSLKNQVYDNVYFVSNFVIAKKQSLIFCILVIKALVTLLIIATNYTLFQTYNQIF